MKKSLIIISLMVTTFLTVHAQVNKVPASKKPIEYKQPDGTTLTLLLKGDEKLHWAETSDGYTLLANKKGGYEYAKLDKNKNLIASGKLAHNADKRSKKEICYLKKTPKGLQFSEDQILKSKK
jgi:immune inhibitor A